MIPQCKGKDLKDVPVSKLLYEDWILMPKYDGNYVQIHKTGDEVRFFTSGDKEFYIPHIAREIVRIFGADDVILETEYIGRSKGLLGDRKHAARLTTYRTNFEKGITTVTKDSYDNFKIFDILSVDLPFSHRITYLQTFTYRDKVTLVTFEGPMSLPDAKIRTTDFISNGYEGCYAKQASHVNKPGTRLNTAIKLKLRLSADLMCVATTTGTGKYEDKVGALVLKDSKGRICSVGSGLTDTERNLPLSYFVGKIIEINYERIQDTYIQPTYVCVRADKTESD